MGIPLCGAAARVSRGDWEMRGKGVFAGRIDSGCLACICLVNRILEALRQPSQGENGETYFCK